jgi:YNFM family putative membrane transporter
MGAYYGGSSVFGALAGVCWSAGGWPAVAALASGLATCALVLMLLLRRTASLA